MEPIVNLIQETQLNCLPLSAERVKEETEKDALLSQVLHKINQGWPSTRKSLAKELYPYFDRKLQLTVHNGCILYSHRVVIPPSLQQPILAEIHEGHMGIVRMKSLARMHVWWPKIDEHIEAHANRCISCQENSREPTKAPVHKWENPKEPWTRLHIDFAGPFEGCMWLIVIDAATKSPEVIKMNNNTTAEQTIEVLRSLFSRLGLPSQIVSDNGPQFTSEAYQKFCINNGIRLTLTAPYHPRSNGEAERFVQTFKNAIRRAKTVGIQKAFCQFLLKYCTTPHPSTRETPSKLMFGREIKTRLQLLHPNELEETHQKTAAKVHTRQFKCDDKVWVRIYSGKSKWIAGKITAITGPVSYKVEVHGRIQRRHIDQLRKRLVDTDQFPPKDVDTSDRFLSFPSNSPSDTERSNTREQRYPTRENRRPPERYRT